MADSMDRHIGTSFRFSGTYETYCDFTYAPDGTFLMYREKSDVVEKELRHCGYFTIVTSAEMDAEKAIAIYKSRDEGSRPNCSIVPAALRELEKIEMTRYYDGIYSLDHAVTKKQKEILSAFGISGDDVKLDAKEVGKVLTIQKRDRSKEAT